MDNKGKEKAEENIRVEKNWPVSVDASSEVIPQNEGLKERVLVVTC